jgi:hypothetical protein
MDREICPAIGALARANVIQPGKGEEAFARFAFVVTGLVGILCATSRESKSAKYLLSGIIVIHFSINTVNDKRNSKNRHEQCSYPR